jgi:exodeoxyribonuclease III
LDDQGADRRVRRDHRRRSQYRAARNGRWNHKALLRVVSHTPVEVEKLNTIREAGPWVDALRHFVAPEEKLYTWWSYRARDWEKSDRGRRLDHVWVSQSLKPRLDGVRILRESRGWERALDHVPVLVHFDL